MIGESSTCALVGVIAAELSMGDSPLTSTSVSTQMTSYRVSEMLRAPATQHVLASPTAPRLWVMEWRAKMQLTVANHPLQLPRAAQERRVATRGELQSPDAS